MRGREDEDLNATSWAIDLRKQLCIDWHGVYGLGARSRR